MSLDDSDDDCRVYYTYLSSPVGKFLLAGNESALRFTSFTTGYQRRKPRDDWIDDSAPLAAAIEPFQRYFDGEPVGFTFPIQPQGTQFQLLVWEALRRIPFGELRSYGQIANALGTPGAARAVGAANAANHLPIVIPCHRVIGADGKLTGFGGGMTTKRKLLELEGAVWSGGSSQLKLI